MDQITTLTAKIKSGHAVTHLSFQLNIDDDYTLLAAEIVDAEVIVSSNEMQEFLDNCIGEYKFNADDHTITFTNNQDYVRYLLAMKDETV